MKKFAKRALSLLLCVLTCASFVPFAASAANSYWGFDDYDTFINPNSNEITSYPTVITKISSDEYSFVSEIDAGKMTITFKEMGWGTYNLWKWNLVDKNGTTHVFLSGGTDLEYVYRTSLTKSGKQYFTGGNHGNEALVSLNFYDGETGEEIKLNLNQSKTVKQLHIIEKTKLLYFPDANGDSVGDYINKTQTYTQDDVFAEVTRKYTVTGPQVRLNVDYKYVKEVYHGVSYTGMFPIAKKYGLYADMIDKDGNFVRTVVTSEVGKADYSGPMNSGNRATRAIIYGKNDSQYQFDVHVNTYEDSLESQRNSFLTAFWDMNTTQNKLYFSKCDTNNPVQYPVGKEVHTECVWRFMYDADGRQPNVGEIVDAEKPATNLLSGLDYEISVTNANPGAPEHNTSYLASLTDGVATTDFNASNDSWFCFSQYKPNIVNGVGSVTVKLDGLYTVNKVRAHLFNNISNMGVKPPKAASAYGIVDGKEVKICDITNISTADGVAYWVSGEGEGVVTDTVIFKFTLDGAFMYVNEVEAYGEEFVVIDPTQTRNLALKKGYEITTGNGKKYGNYTASLTDGYFTSSISYDDKWFTFYNNSNYPADCNVDNGIGVIVIDLEDIYSIESVKINSIDLYGDSGIKKPKSVTVYLSENGTDWSEAIPLTIPATEKNVAFAIEGATEGAARYVKIETVLDGMFAFMNEIEVYGKNYVPDENPDPDVPPVVEPESKLGDVNDDGAIDQFDYILVKRHYFETRLLTDDELPRADVNGDEVIDQFDYILIKRHYFGTYTIG